MPEPAFHEKPLGSFSRARLMIYAGLNILFFYVFALLSTLFLLSLLAVEFSVLLVLIRFGLARIMANQMQHHIPLLPIFARSFWLRRDVEYRIVLKPEDAPGLFAVLDELSKKVSISPPRFVHLLLDLNAHVQLKGYRQGAGTTILGVGYDLLAGLSVAEVEAVLAHEITHAKQIRRGLSHWLSAGLLRIITLTQALASLAEAYRRAKKDALVLRFLLRNADWFARTGSRLVAAYSRQEEFTADRGAAELCGAAPLRSALLRMDMLGQKLSRLPLNERVALLQQGRGFSQWLVSELAQVEAAQTHEAAEETFNKYATHPLLRDRLAALQEVGSQEARGNPEPAMGLLTDPDGLAEKLIAEIQRKIVAMEEKDSRELARWQRKTRTRVHLRPLQLLGVILVLLSIIVGLFITACSESFSFVVVASAVVGIVVGVLLFRFGRFRDRLILPVPEFSLFLVARQKLDEKESAEAQQQMEKELLALVADKKGKRRQARILAEACFLALTQCDYLRADVAARLCLERNPKSVEGLLGRAIASAATGQSNLAIWSINEVHRRSGLDTFSTRWGCAWTLAMLGNWAQAEAFLSQAWTAQPEYPTLPALLALCRARRGKLQSAILNARESCQSPAKNKAHVKQLINFLLNAGYLREAQEWLRTLESEVATDTDLMYETVRVHLLTRSFDHADKWAAQLQQSEVGAQMLVHLGECHEIARRDEKAVAYYRQALDVAYYPAAFLGLARLAANENRREEAEQHLFAAMDTTRPLGKDAVGPLPLLGQTLGLLLALRKPVDKCRAWFVTFNNHAWLSSLAGVSFRVCAPDQRDAETFLSSMFLALQPGKPPVSPLDFTWHDAPPEQQPDGLVRPGIHGIVN